MKKIVITCTALFVSLSLPIQAAAKTTAEVPNQIGNAYFWAMMVIIVLLLVIIVGLNNSISLVVQYNRSKKNKSSSVIKTVTLLLATGAGIPASAQEANTSIATSVEATSPFSGLIYGMQPLTFYALLTLVIIELIIIAVQVGILRSLLPRETKQLKPIKEGSIKVFLERFNRSVAIEKEEDIMMGHEYDGIRELDNNLPPWWIYGFYITIVWAVVYLIHFHITGTGALQEEEYRQEMAQAQIDIDNYLARMASNVDENSFKILTDKEVLKSGEGIYQMNCISCHGLLGEGKVGPNLTDNYWLHGGSAKEVFSSIKYGWVEKGMKSWKNDLTPTEISKVTSYIFSLQGTQPANAKEPEGIIYEEKPADSTVAVSPDTSAIIQPQ